MFSASRFSMTPQAACAAGLLALAALSYLLFFDQLAARDLWSSHEARAAQNAQTMLDDGNWLLPRLYDGRPELQKPPLYYWLTASIARLRGDVVDAWAVRLPAALGAVGCILLLWLVGWRQGRPLAGFFSAVTLATLVRFTWQARVGRIDMPLTFAVALSLCGFYLGWWAAREGHRWAARCWLTMAWTAAAAAALLKGPIGPVLIALAGTTLLALEKAPAFPWHGRRWLALLRDLGVPWGLPLWAALVLPWFLLVHQATAGQFFQEFLLRHTLQRGLGGDEQLEAHDSPLAFGYYVIRLAYDAAPWSWLLPVAVYFFWKCGGRREDGLARFGLVWFAAMLVFFSVMRYKRPDYLLPAFPGLALFLGCMGERGWWAARQRQRLLAAAAASSMVLACAMGWLVYVHGVLPAEEPGREHRTFAAEIRRRAGPASPIVVFRTESHALLFHLGRPVTRIMEWENLDIWACQPAPFYVVMPAEWADEQVRRRYLEAGKLYPTASNGAGHHEPLILLCTRPVGD